MRLNQLQYLVALRKHGTFSKAAQALYISQPSISVGIRELEEELGYPLLSRNNRGVQFTLEGLQVLERAQLILNEVDNIHRIQREDKPLAGEVRMGSTPHFCNSILLDVMLQIEGRYPQCSLLMEECDSETILRRIEEGSLQMGLVQLCDVDEELLLQRVSSRKLQYEELFREEMCIVVGEHHPLAQQETVKVEELLRYPYATYKDAMNYQVAQMLKKYDCRERVSHVREIVSLRKFIMRTESYTVIPRRAVLYGNFIYQDKLIPLNVPEISWKSSVGWAHGGAPLDRVERAVLEELILRCKEYQE